MKFGPIEIDDNLVIYQTGLTFVFLSIQPIKKYHLLICPKRVIDKYKDLTDEEIRDFSKTLKFITSKLQKELNCSTTLNIQDGPFAGQVIKHVHMHLVTREEGDLGKNKNLIGEFVDEENFKLKDESNLAFISKEDLIEQSAFLSKLFSS